MKEVWKDVIDYEGYYQVSNLGRVRSVDREVYYRGGRVKKIKGNIMKLGLSKNGYPQLTIYKKGKQKSCRVHRLVANAFIPNDEDKPMVNHINGIKTDNRLENLEWCTAKENSNHAYEIGLINEDTQNPPKGEECHLSVLTEKEAKEIYELAHNSKMTMREIGEIYNITLSGVSGIKQKRIWKHIHE